MNEKEKIRAAVQFQVNAWVDSLGDATTVEDACEVMKYALQLCNATLKYWGRPSPEKKQDG